MATAGAIRAGRANVELGLDKTKFQRDLKGIGHDLKQVGSKLALGGAALAGFGTAILAPLAKATQMAGDFAETVNRFEAVFGAQAKATDEWATSLAESVGRSKVEILDAMSSFQGFFVGLGFGGEQAAAFSKKLQALSIDFASFNNLSDAEATERFISALSGSSEVLDKFGVNIKQAALEAELLAQGVKKSWTEVTEQEKAVARMDIIMRSMTDQGAVGDAVKTSGSFANQLKALKAEVVDTAIAVGQSLLPVATKLVSTAKEILQPLAEWVKRNQNLVVGIAAIGTTAVTLGAPLAAMGIAINGIGSALTMMGSTAKVAVTAMMALNAVPMVAALSAVAIAVTALSGHFDPLIEKMLKFMGLWADMPGGDIPFGKSSVQTSGPLFDAQRRRRDENLRGAGRSSPNAGPTKIKITEEQFNQRFPGQEVPESVKNDAAAKPTGPSLIDLASNIGKNLKLEIDIKASLAKNRVNVGKQWAEEFGEAMEDRRKEVEEYTEKIADAQSAIADKEHEIALAKDDTNLVTQSAAAGVSGLGTTSVDEKQLTELQEMRKDLEKLRKEIAGER